MDGEESRHPIQLQPDVKRDFDRLLNEFRDIHSPELTQSRAVKILIDFYRENAHRVQV